MSAYQKSTLILRVEPWTLCSEADKESEHTEGEISRREDFMTRCDRHVLSLPAKTACHEIRDQLLALQRNRRFKCKVLQVAK